MRRPLRRHAGRLIRRPAPRGFRFRTTNQPPSSLVMSWVVLLALLSTVAPAVNCVWSRVKLAISDEKLVSVMTELAEVVFDRVVWRLLALACSVLSWNEPRLPLRAEIW